MKRLEAVVSGRVQGVGFREFVRYQASSRGITGYVRNGDNRNTVELVAEGDGAALEDLVKALHEGPRFAHVDEVSEKWVDAGRGFARFSVEL